MKTVIALEMRKHFPYDHDRYRHHYGVFTSFRGCAGSLHGSYLTDPTRQPQKWILLLFWHFTSKRLEVKILNNLSLAKGNTEIQTQGSHMTLDDSSGPICLLYGAQSNNKSQLTGCSAT